VVQPEDVTDMHYRTVSGDSDVLKGQLEEITLPYKKLREMRPDEKARLSRTSSMMLPARWSAGGGSTSLQMWSKAPKLNKPQLETIKHRTPVYYGYPEGPAKGMHRLRAVGSASEKEQIVLNNGYQALLSKMFPVMDMVQRNSLALQEMIMEKTMTSERMAKADCGLGLTAVDCAELQLQSFQTNMLMTHMRHEFHNAIGKQYRDATKLTGQLNEMAACEHGDIGLGAGSSSEMEQLKVFSNEKRKQRDVDGSRIKHGLFGYRHHDDRSDTPYNKRNKPGPGGGRESRDKHPSGSDSDQDRTWRDGNDSDTSADESRDRDRDGRGGDDKIRGGGDRYRRYGGDRDVSVSTRVTADGKQVNPNYKGDLADYKPDFRPGGKHRKASPRRQRDPARG
jgi:hypothetical protein